MTVIKICGMTNKKDALEAADLGADMLGFVFYKKSKRYVEPGTARDIINELPEAVKKVGVFVDEEKGKVLDIAGDAGLDILQFHGGESREYCKAFRDEYGVIKAFRMKGPSGLRGINDYDADYYLFDTAAGDSVGGTGKTFDWKILKDFEILKPFILAGGLDPGNVGHAVKELVPYGVDVSTGVELSPGKKDASLMKKFIETVRKAQDHDVTR
jgi:phosphoribosylanthranilate isomerase